MIIDAMDILHGHLVDGFCIVSSDSDYTRLATRVREMGFFVMGVGKRSTPKAFVNGCNVFIYTENLVPRGRERARRGSRGGGTGETRDERLVARRFGSMKEEPRGTRGARDTGRQVRSHAPAQGRLRHGRPRGRLGRPREIGVDLRQLDPGLRSPDLRVQAAVPAHQEPAGPVRGPVEGRRGRRGGDLYQAAREPRRAAGLRPVSGLSSGKRRGGTPRRSRSSGGPRSG